MTPPADFVDGLDLAAFAAELEALEKRATESLGPEDAEHLAKLERWGRACTALGYATAWIAPNPLSIAAISTGRLARWVMVGHHVSHRGYDKVEAAPRTRTSKRFAKGWRRLVDWFDWIEPESWSTEHNWLHHYHLNEEADPDLVERNLDFLRDSDLPRWAKLAIVGFFATTWKAVYYAPNAYFEHANVQAKRRREPPPFEEVYETALDPKLWTDSILPYGLGVLVGVPALYAPLGPWAVFSAATNSFLAELLTNVHSFVIIVPNHAGDDLYRFETRSESRSEHYLRQVLGSANYRTGGDVNDFLHGFLNYQIEHHLFPKLPMRKLQEIQPEVQRICERHGVPYVQHSVWTRLRKAVSVMIGDETMQHDPRLDGLRRRGREQRATVNQAAS